MGREMMRNERKEMRSSKVMEDFEGPDKKFAWDAGMSWEPLEGYRKVSWALSCKSDRFGFGSRIPSRVLLQKTTKRKGHILAVL